MRLENRVAVITGGASGIGAGTARLFAAHGARVVVADMNEEDGARVAKELGDVGHFVRTDVSREPDMEALMETAVERFGRIDCLFNNAGFGGALGPIESTSLADYDLTFDVLLKSVFLGTKHVAPIMKAQGSGSIINTASVAGLQAGWAPHLYTVAKAAVVQLTKTTALELAEAGVRVNCICPGFIATPLAAGRSDVSDAQLDKMRDQMAGAQPLGRIGEPEDIGYAALYLACDESSFVTGQIQVVDGGFAAGRAFRSWPEWIREPKPIRMHRPAGR